MASAKHKSSPSYASAATSSATSTSTATGPMVSYHVHHPLNSRPSVTLSREASPSPRASMSALHRPAFVHSTTSYAVGAVAGTAAGSPYASGHGSRRESRGGSSKPFDEDGGCDKEVSAYYPPESPHPNRPYPYPHYQYTPFAQPDRPSANTCAMDRLKTSVRTMCGANGDRESKLACLQCSSAEEGGQLGKIMMWAWVITTVGFFLAIAFWRGELFRGKFSIQEDSRSMNCMHGADSTGTALDKLSHYLAGQGIYGHLTFYALIFITTIPPLPLYSTLIILSGYTFGVWQGFLVSYLASLSGAIAVFVASRKMLRDTIVKR